MLTCNASNQYLIGSASVITVNITKAGVLIDPTALTFEYEQPDSTIITYTYGVGTNIVKTSTGIYTITVVLSQSGVWRYRWQSTAPNHGAVEGSLIVNPSIIS